MAEDLEWKVEAQPWRGDNVHLIVINVSVGAELIESYSYTGSVVTGESLQRIQRDSYTKGRQVLQRHGRPVNGLVAHIHGVFEIPGAGGEFRAELRLNENDWST